MKNITGIFMGVFIIMFLSIIFKINPAIELKASAISESQETAYSDDGYYKYQSECIYDGILIDEKDFKVKYYSPEFNEEIEKYNIFSGEIQSADDCNYQYDFSEESDIFEFKTNADESCYGYDTTFYLKILHCISSDKEAQQYINRIQTLYKVYDKEYIYDNALRVYVRFTSDTSEIRSISSNITSVSKPLVDEKGDIYYEIRFTDDTDIDVSDFVQESLLNTDFSADTELIRIEKVYKEISCNERIISENIHDYNFDDFVGLLHSNPSSADTFPATEDFNDYTTTFPKPLATVTTLSTIAGDQNEFTDSNNNIETNNSPDINGDGIVNMADAVIISDILQGSVRRDSDYIRIADVNNDGVIDDMDYLKVVSSINGYGNNIKNITVNLNSCDEGADCYVKILSNVDLSDVTGEISLQKNMFGKYIEIMRLDIVTEGFYYIFNEKYPVDFDRRYRLIADVFYDHKRVTVDDSCFISLSR
ncbi:MAG: dockerin type I repeat-containing protein [Oscillospiraceae bacterium]|nr:dockerin type I repeat-containing protein [Oscillospiraceae bacterium]